MSNKMGLVNLKDLVETAAHKWYKDNEKDATKAKWGKTYNWKELTKEIDWRAFKLVTLFKRLIVVFIMLSLFIYIYRVRHDQPLYTDIEAPGTPKNHILFRSTFLNDTNREQEYNLKAVRRTVSTCSFSIFEGYTTEQCASLELEVPLPKCVLEASTGFRREYALEQSRDKQVEEELTWSVESNLKVSDFNSSKCFHYISNLLPIACIYFALD